MTSGQLTYAEEHAYSVAPVVQREPAIKSESRAFEARYDFCSSNAGVSNTYLELFKMNIMHGQKPTKQITAQPVISVLTFSSSLIQS